jgi:hypothetical protein
MQSSMARLSAKWVGKHSCIPRIAEGAGGFSPRNARECAGPSGPGRCLLSGTSRGIDPHRRRSRRLAPRSPKSVPPMPLDKHQQPQQQQQDKQRHNACQKQALGARLLFGSHAAARLEAKPIVPRIPHQGLLNARRPSNSRRRAFRQQFPTYPVTVRVGLEPHSP